MAYCLLFKPQNISESFLEMVFFKMPFLCTVDGGVSGWGEWSCCDKLCQPGRMTRQKECDNPKPKCGGKQCDLKILQKETKECNYCPGNKPYLVLQCAIFLTTCK